MLSSIIATVLKWLGGGVLDRVLGHLEKRADSDIERRRVEAVRAQHMATLQAGVIVTGMQFKIFWVPWGMIAIPFAGWLGWGYLDSAFNGDLPDVAALPPQLKEYADVVIANLFFSGGGVAAVQGAASIIGSAISRRR